MTDLSFFQNMPKPKFKYKCAECGDLGACGSDVLPREGFCIEYLGKKAKWVEIEKLTSLWKCNDCDDGPCSLSTRREVQRLYCPFDKTPCKWKKVN